VAVATVASLAGTALGPAGPAQPGPAGTGVEQAQAAGGGNVNQIGSKTAQLFRSWLGPLVIVLVGAGGLVAFFRREIGIAVTLAVIAVFLGLFIFAPTSAQHLIQGFWKKIAG
jgi:hypothetical protein